jgi:polyhydroxybutyrate depolymerase
MKLCPTKPSTALAAFLTTCVFGRSCSAEDPSTGSSAGSTSTGGSPLPSAGATTGGSNSGSGGAASTLGGSGQIAGGSPSFGGSSSNSGGRPSAGTNAGGASAGETSAGSAGKSAGSAGKGGGGAGGASGGTGGASAGSGGQSAGGSGGGAKASAGCSKGTARPAGGSVSKSSYYLTFPPSYDGKTPVPVLFGFHGCGGVNRGTSLETTEYVKRTVGTPFESGYVVAVPISQDTGGCWNYGNDIARIKAAYDELVANYCVDQGKVFATGHSSGANLIGEILNTSHAADAKYLGFKGVAPVAGSPQTIAAPIPVMYIQGIMDRERSNSDGANVVQRFTTANMCMSTYTTYSAVMGCKSAYDQADVDPGCRLYDGCSVKTVWCRHNDGDYSGTMHGIPCFAMKAMHDFFQSLP